MELKVIAKIQCDFKGKFGVPRASGIVDGLIGRVVFEPQYRDAAALRGIEGYSHIWLIWGFSENDKREWSATVRPPRLGGNKRVGVFASRSPYRPNPVGLSSVRLMAVERTEKEGCVLVVEGADLVDGTPIYDIKPYIPFTDCHPNAIGGFADEVKDYSLNVEFPDKLLEQIPAAKRAPLIVALSHDPRPAYQDNPDRVYGLVYANFEVKFKVQGNALTVLSVAPID